MPKDSRARTRAVRGRMAATGETYTAARAALTAPPRMDRDTPPEAAISAVLFGELMVAGQLAARRAPEDLPAAIEAVRAMILPLWPKVLPEAARDVMAACAEIAARRGITSLPSGIDSVTAATVLELAAEPAGAITPPGGMLPHVAYASSAAFDRDEDAETLTAVCVLLAVAHPPAAAGPGADDDWPDACPECGGDDPQGTYGCSCFNPSACSECGDPNGDCDCWA